MTPSELMARMGELVVSATAGDVLCALGLGSCIGLALLDRQAGVAGLAHVVLPSATDPAGTPGKFANFAVPALIDVLVGLGARRARLQAVMAGGASMFATANDTLEVGRRNERAVREALKIARIPVTADDCGGNRGRTMRVYLEGGRVTVRLAGAAEGTLVPVARRAAA